MKNQEDYTNPSYYKTGDVELIEAIRTLPYSLGNATKYIFRAGDKLSQPCTHDLKKARWYINDYLENIVPVEMKPDILLDTSMFVKLTNGISADRRLMMAFVAEFIRCGGTYTLNELLDYIEECLEREEL